jgi:hypothetical protein
MLGAGSLLAKRYEIGFRHKENKEKRNSCRHDEARRNGLLDGGAKRKSSLQEKDATQNSSHHSGKRNQATKIASGDPEDDAEWAPKKDQHAYHDEGGQEKADDGRGSPPGSPLPKGERGSESAKHESDDLWPDILCGVIFMEIECSGYIP